MSEKLGLFIASCIFLVLSFLGVVVFYNCLYATPFYNIVLGVFTATITLCPLSAISFLYERKAINQQFIREVSNLLSTESRLFETNNAFNQYGYALIVKNLSNTILELDKVSKKKGRIAQEIQNYLLEQVSTLKSSNNLIDSFELIVSNVNAYIDQLV